MHEKKPRLTEMAHGGGCGCKLAPSVLSAILKDSPAATLFPDLLVGSETADDAAVYRLSETMAVVATTDFFTPVVDDPYEFGRIAATNALSDVYAMGGKPIFALAILGVPVATMAVEVVQQILAGGTAVCAAAGIPVAGGHSIDAAEPIYGLVAVGLVHPDRVLRNTGARAGDVLVLTKGLGVGVFSAALKRGKLDAAGYAAMLESTTRLNSVGAGLGEMAGVHACTDVTGFGLLGHSLEMARGSGVRVRLDAATVPFLAGAEALARAGVQTGAGARNWASYGGEVTGALPAWLQALLCDPQTSGGLLIAVARDRAEPLMARVVEAGFGAAAVIGVVEDGSGVVVDI